MRLNHIIFLPMMKEFSKQLVTIWRELKPLQKGAFAAIIFCVALAMVCLLLKPSSTFIPLYSGKTLAKAELEQVRSYLEHFAIPFEDNKEKGLKVLSQHAEQIRLELAAAGIPKQNSGKGFELFDTNTWIKGDRELQVLEMRALKGQIEKDLAGFEHIKSASVILDMPPQRSFNGAKYQTKASVILTLMPSSRLSISELKAITNHLAGAVRGLQPNMIAVSDTTGKLYKAIDPKGEEEPFHYAQSLFEEHIERKLNDLFSRLVGEAHFYITVQAALSKETEEVLSLSMGAVVDKNVLAQQDLKQFKTEVARQMQTIASGYGLSIEPALDIIPFEKERKIWTESKHRANYTGLFFTILFVILFIFAAFPLFRSYEKNKKEEDGEQAFFRIMTRVDLDKLALSIKNENPSTIALMLSYLEPKRAEQIMAALSRELQEQVLFHLSELEKKG